jgi:hypothetical protein
LQLSLACSLFPTVAHLLGAHLFTMPLDEILSYSMGLKARSRHKIFDFLVLVIWFIFF